MKTRKGGRGWVVALGVVGCAVWGGCGGAGVGKDGGKLGTTASPPSDPVPAAKREFRGVFVQSAYHFDWPDKTPSPGNGNDSGKNPLREIVRRVKEMNCNVIIVQLRGFGERMYKNTGTAENWGTGLNNGADPGYDPLAKWVEAAHKQGIEVHAWINPCRSDKYNLDTKLDLTPAEYGKKHKIYMYHAGAPKFRERILCYVIPELLTGEARLIPAGGVGGRPGPVNRESTTQPGGGDDDGADGILIDHYVPPPDPEPRPATGRAGGVAPMVYDGHTMEQFVQDMYKTVTTTKAWAKFGVSPMQGQDVEAGPWVKYCHYVVPELYGQGMNQPDVSGALDTWAGCLSTTVTPAPLVVAGLGSFRVDPPERGQPTTWNPSPPSEIVGYVDMARVWSDDPKVNRPRGEAMFTVRSLRHKPTKDGLADLLEGPQYYAEPAVVPACVPGSAGVAEAENLSAGGGHVSWDVKNNGATPWLWEVWGYDAGNGGWKLYAVNGPKKLKSDLVPSKCTWWAVRGVNHYGQEGTAVEDPF